MDQILLPFAIVIFVILDVIAFVLDLTAVASIAGVFISFLSTLFYILYVFFVYGSSKAVEKLFSFKNKTGKKIMKIFGGSVIPFVNVWAVYDDYREEKKIKENKEKGITEDSSQNKGSGIFKKLILGAGVIATGGAAAGVLAGEAAVAGEAAAVAEGNVASKAITARGEAKVVQGNFGSGIGKKLANKGSKKTIEEEIGGVKTGLNREDYDSGISDYSRMDTYEKNNDIQRILAKVQRGERLTEVEGNKYNSYQINGAHDEMNERNDRGNGSVSGGRVGREVSRKTDPDIQRILAKVQRGERLTEVEGNKYNSYQIFDAHDEMNRRR
ncbi:MAG: hypothetical protein QG630_46 [Patescibacteria group bacterium]|nr:hypothetical protein [Patescibacteria group bacterium]